MVLPDTVSPRRLTRVSTCFRQDTAGAFGKAILLFYSRHGPSVSIGFSAGSNVIPLDMLPHAEDANYFRLEASRIEGLFSHHPFTTLHGTKVVVWVRALKRTRRPS